MSVVLFRSRSRGVNLNFLGMTALPSFFNFARASTGRVNNTSGTQISAAVNEARFDNNPSTLAARGLLIEGARTNIMLNSGDIVTSWAANVATKTANTTVAPDGTTTADTITTTAVSFSGVFTTLAVSNATTYTFSIFGKHLSGSTTPWRIGWDAAEFGTGAQTGQAYVNLQTGAITSPDAGVVRTASYDIGGGYWRFEITATTAVAGGVTSIVLYAGDASIKSAAWWGAQVEAASFASSYIPTAASAVTRATDMASVFDISRTNYIRNSTMAGATVGVVGSGGSLATNYLIYTARNLTTEVIESGVDYSVVKISGTANSSGNYQIAFDGINFIPAATGQVWTDSCYLTLVAGSASTFNSIFLGVNENTSAGAYVTGGSSSELKNSLSATEARYEFTRTLSGGGTVGNIQPLLALSVTSGNTYDITLRIRSPQLEKRPLSTSTATAYIPTYGSAVTVYDSPMGFNPTEGTVVVEFENPYTLASGWSNRAILELASSATDYMHVILDTSGKLRMTVVNSGATQVNVDDGGAVRNAGIHKVAFAYKANDFAISTDGETPVTDLIGTIPSVTGLYLFNRFNGSSQLFGWGRKLTYYPTRLPNATLQALTA